MSSVRASTWGHYYAKLELSFREGVETDNRAYGCSSVYLPNIMPKGAVDFVLVGMEPSLGRWARTIEDAQTVIKEGFKDFAFSFTDFILHFCVREYLCLGGKTHHLTNLSKGAMKVRDAGSQRRQRTTDLSVSSVSRGRSAGSRVPVGGS